MSRKRDMNHEYTIRKKREHRIAIGVDREKWERLDTEQKTGMRTHLKNAATEYFETSERKEQK